MYPISNGEREEIEKLAHRLWEERGGPLGSPDDDWLRAEQEFIQQRDDGGQELRRPAESVREQ